MNRMIKPDHGLSPGTNKTSWLRNRLVLIHLSE